MSEQVPPQRKPKSLLETHQDTQILIKALNEHAGSLQNPVSWDMMSDLKNSSSSRVSMRFFPEKSSQSQMPDTSVTKEIPNAFPIPVVRRKPKSEQPSVSQLSGIGVKVRDFAYESTLPPVPTVYRQPRQIQPSVPKDENDPNDPHYVLEEERKKRVYTFQSTRKIERTPTEPVLESEQAPPPKPTFPGIRRTGAQLNLDSQVEPRTPPAPQPIPVRTSDWVDTPIVTPNGSLHWPDPDATAFPTSQREADSHTLHMPDHVSYSRMGFVYSVLSHLPQLIFQGSGVSTPITDLIDQDSPMGERHAAPAPLNTREPVDSNPEIGGSIQPLPQPSLRFPPRSPSSVSAVSTTVSSISAIPRSSSPRYNLRNKRPANSPPASPVHIPLRPRILRGDEQTVSGRPGIVSSKSTHAQVKPSTPGLSGRTLKRERGIQLPTTASPIASGPSIGTRSKRSNS